MFAIPLDPRRKGQPVSVPPVTIFFEVAASLPRRRQRRRRPLGTRVRVLSHSPKYGRPRGLHCARGGCMSCLMRVDGVPNVRSCKTPVRDGMRVERQDSGAVYGAPCRRP